ncbi:MAG: uracil-DNA glycosylase [candidate division NC10 bacterium]|nr:uracil-DNA glycosylase [candidate division NC10 bacterium]MCZ6550252.1 uracil-DNA glycosylase [candidate division NC10 bacterium]
MDPRDVRHEAAELVKNTRDSLEAQRQLGLDFLPGAPAVPEPERPRSERERLLSGTLSLVETRQVLGECTRCKLHPHRTQIVFGVGHPQADLVFVGEAPGADEDAQGEPFVGRAGQLLTRMIEAMGLKRQDVYICNVIKCRPPSNRTPESDEIASCEPFLIAQIKAITPKLICALGGIAVSALLKTKAPLSKLRGRFHDYQGIPLLVTYHPAYLLRNPNEKKSAWQDLQLLQKEYTRLTGRPLG